MQIERCELLCSQINDKIDILQIHQRDKQASEEFNLFDKAERDLFIHLQAAVKTSHEKEKIHTNSAKYWSIVGSLLGMQYSIQMAWHSMNAFTQIALSLFATFAGALIGICGTAFSFYNRNKMITTMLTEVQSEFVHLRDEAAKNRTELHQLVELLRQQAERDALQRQLTADNKSAAAQSTESSWLHWLGRTTYVISAYRYFAPRSD